MHYLLIESPLGILFLLSDGDNLKKLSFIKHLGDFEAASDWHQESDAILEETKHQLQEWFAGKRQNFNLPLSPDGTGFQKQVWQQLLEVPYGKTCTYGEQAKAMNKPTASRAVGAANGQNPIALIIPCHRVIGANGSLTGYAFGVDIKQKLLTFEADQLAEKQSFELV